MGRWQTVILVFLYNLLLGATSAYAQEPYVLSPTVQEFAIKIGLGQKLGINWLDSSAEDIATYVDFLASAEVIAQHRAEFDERETPVLEDYAAGFIFDCFWPPNKKPRDWIQKQRSMLRGTFASAEKRAEIREAMGPLLLRASPQELSDAIETTLTPLEYRRLVFNFNAIR